MTEPIIINYKDAQIRMCARNVIKCAMGDMKLNHDLYIQYEYLMQSGRKELIDLVRKVIDARGFKI